MIIIKCDATDCKNNFDGECHPEGDVVKCLNISQECTASGFYPICKDYTEDEE